MAATISSAGAHSIGDSVVLEHGTVNVGTYATSGVAVDDTGDIEWLPGSLVGQAQGYVAHYVASTKKIIVRYQTDPAAAGGADVPLKEVANSTNLASVDFPFIAIRTR
jgi:hypothetical protein